MPFLRLFEKLWRLQGALGGFIHGENRVGPEAWKHILAVYEANLHQCALGLKHPLSKLPIMKPTRVLTSDPELAKELSACRCPGHERHACLEGQYKGSPLTKWAKTYPQGLCRKVAQVILNRDQADSSDVDIFVGSDDEADSEQSDTEAELPPPETEVPRAPRVRPPNYKATIQKLRANTGHASVPQMLRLAQRARAPAPVLQAIKDFLSVASVRNCKCLRRTVSLPCNTLKPPTI